MAFLIRNWKLLLFGGALLVAVSATGAAYALYLKNATLRDNLAEQIAQVAVLEDARERDAEAARRLIEAMATEQALLEERLTALSEITDEAGKNYLDTLVPDSVQRLFNP